MKVQFDCFKRYSVLLLTLESIASVHCCTVSHDNKVIRLVLVDFVLC